MMFSVYKENFEKVGLFVNGDQVVTAKGDVVAVVNPYGEVETKDEDVLKIMSSPVEKPKKKATKEK